MQRRPVSSVSLVVAIATGALLAPLAATPAAADPGDDVVIVPTTVPYLTPDGTTTNSIHITDLGSVQIDIDDAALTPPAPQCTPLPAAGVDGSLCIGAPSGIDPTQEALTVGGLNDFLSADDLEAPTALGWLMREAIDAVGRLYDLPADGRVARYAGDQVRAYMVTRILDILDKALYGIELTADESRAMEFISTRILTADQKLSRWAVEEYESFQAAQCGYVPPAAPPFVPEADRATMPQSVLDWCARRHTRLETQFVFAPPQPSAEHFQAWAMYRHADELGLTDLASPEMQDALGDTNRAAVALGGMAVAAGGAAVAAATAGASFGAASAFAGAMASSALVGTSLGATSGTTLVSVGAVSTVGAIAGASIVAVVVTAIVVTAVAIWQLVEYEKVGQTLRERRDEADDADDAFGIAVAAPEFAGLPLRTGLDASNLPSYRTPGSIARINEIITGTTSAKFSGIYVPDADTLWNENATTADDFRFNVTDASGTQVADQLTIPVDGIDTTLRFSKGWMITDTGDGEKPALEFNFIDPDGEKVLATRAPAEVGGFTLSRVSDDGTLTSEAAASFTYLDAAGQPVTVSLVGQSTSGLGGPIPSAVGPLTPGRTVILRPNPTDDQGRFELDRFTTGYDYTWTVQRYDAGSSQWIDAIAPVAGYDARFKPTELGSYRASVLMHDTDPADGIDDDIWGLVEFEVTPPEIQAVELALTDDGSDRLQLSAQFGAEVPSDDFTVEVQWPGSVGGTAGATASVDLECHTIDPLSCSSVDTDAFPELKSALSTTLPLDAATSQGVDVMVTDRFGAALTHHFDLEDPRRPKLTPPETAPSADASGTVSFTPGAISVEVPVQDAGNPNYELARIQPGSNAGLVGLGILDPVTGNPGSAVVLANGAATVSASAVDAPTGEWALDLHVTADIDDLGSITVPLVVQQVPGPTRVTTALTIEFVPSSGDRYRAAIARDIPPFAVVEEVPLLVPYVMGGQDEWGEYAGDLCVSVFDRNLPPDPAEQCGPLASFLGEDGTLQPIPIAELLGDRLRNSLFEVSAWLRSDDEHVDTTPTSFVFALDAPEPTPPPTVSGFGWNQSTRTLTFTATPGDPSAPITGYACTIDGASTPCPDAAQGRWSGSALSAGQHVFGITVTDSTGAQATGSHSFTVTATPTPPQPPLIVTVVVTIVTALLQWLRKLFR